MYLLERQAEDSDKLLSQLIDSFRETVRLYKKFMYDILQQDTAGWNHLSKPIPEESYGEIIETLQEMKQSEECNVAAAERIMDSHARRIQESC